jgi:MFS family permease
MNIIIILALNVLLYAKSLKLNYVSDDLQVLKFPPPIKNKWHKRFLWLIGSYKFIPPIDHLLTLVFHALVSVFIYLAFGSSQLSFIAALLFTANPANNQGSIWIAGRGYVIPSLMLLISLYLPILAPFLFWGMGYFVAGYLAPLALLGSKNAYLLAIMPFYWIFWWKKFRGDVHRKLVKETVVEDSKINLKKFILAIKTMGFYFTLGIVPFRLTFYHSFLQSCAGNEIMKKRAYKLCKFFWFGILAICLFIYLLTKGWNLTTYGLLWFFINIAPFCNFRRVQQEISERYLYLPNVGLMLALGSLIYQNQILVAVFLTMYITRLLTFYIRAYQDDYWLMESAVYEDPGAWYAWHIRGFKRWEVQSYREALTMWVMAQMLDPKEFKLLFNIAVVLKLLKKDAESAEFLKKAEENIIPGQEKDANELIRQFKTGTMPLVI